MYKSERSALLYRQNNLTELIRATHLNVTFSYNSFFVCLTVVAMDHCYNVFLRCHKCYFNR